MISLNPNKAKGSRFSHKLESFLWWIIRLLPLIFYVIYFNGVSQADVQWEYVFSDGDPTMFSALNLSSFMDNFFRLSDDNLVLQVFRDIFGSSGVFSLFESYSGIFSYLSYLVCIEILRMMYNVVVFIPRLAHKWISNAIQDD